MLGPEDNDHLPGGSAPRRPYFRSFSWTDRSPTKPNPRPHPPKNSKARACLPPLQPLSIARRPAEEWPKAGSDDLGVWPNPQTPRGPAKLVGDSKSELPPVREFQFKKDKLAFYDKECSRISEHIYLGSDAVAKNREILRQNGITHVLNCVGFVCPEYFKNDLVYKTLWLQDIPSEDITSILYDVFDYFEDVREQAGRVFVHCCQGVSRSNSLVIAYLMWREGQSFEDAFQYVKAARGVTNPNMGFACQLLQCQKRVHAVPPSPNSVLRMFRMAPHSSYAPLHLVPKLLSQPGVQGLDSRGAFIIHVPTAIFVWVGVGCNPVMSNHGRTAANQVIRYERAQGPIVIIKEGEEPQEFWDALDNGQNSADTCAKDEVKKEDFLSSCDSVATGVNQKKVDEYDFDFELFHKALSGGVVPPFSVSNAESETCLPARENGWGRLRQKFANGKMKEFVSSSRLSSDAFSSPDDESDILQESQQPVSPVDDSMLSSPSAYSCGSPDSFECSPNSRSDRTVDYGKEVEQCISLADHVLPIPSPSGSSDSFSLSDPVIQSPSPCGSPDSFSCFLDSKSRLGYKSPTFSPSTSDYSSSSFTFSPSSSNWSDLSSRQPSPSGLDHRDHVYVKNVSFEDNFLLGYKDASTTPKKVICANHDCGDENTCLLCKGISPSIAERRGSVLPPRMLLPTIHEPSKAPRKLARSWSFSTPDLDDADDDVIEDLHTDIDGHGSIREEKFFDTEGNMDQQVLGTEIDGSGNDSQSEIGEKKDCFESFLLQSN